MFKGCDETVEMNSAKNPFFWARIAANVGILLLFLIIVIVMFARWDDPMRYRFLAILGFLALIVAVYLAWSAIPEKATIGPSGVDIKHGPIHRTATWPEVSAIKAARVLTASGKHIRTRPALVIKGPGWKYTLSSAKHPEDDLRRAYYKAVLWARAQNAHVLVEDEYGWLGGGY